MSSSGVEEDTQLQVSAEKVDSTRIQSTSVQQQNNRSSVAEATSPAADDGTQMDEQSETLGPRHRIATEKGKSGKIDRLRQRRITALGAVTRQRNALSAVMTDSNNLHLVKFELSQLEERFAEYKRACDSHLKELIEGKEKQAVIDHNKLKEKDIVIYLSQVSSWITEAEHNLSDRLESLSSKVSDRTQASRYTRASKTSSRSSKLSARKQEKVKLAELLAEKSMLKKRQALKNAEEDLKLEIEIVKTEAREKALAEMSEDELSHYNTRRPESFSTASSFRQLPILNVPPQSSLLKARQPIETSHSATEKREILRDQTLPQRRNQSSDPTPQQVQFPPNPRPLENEYATFVDPTLVSIVNNEVRTTRKTSDEDPSLNVANVTERILESMMLLQQRQTETLISTHQQLTASMNLPQPSITIFKGDLLEYRTFVTSFDTRIRHRVNNSADLLYYLNQHLSGEPKDLIEGCLHMDSDEGYAEARRLLKKEYGDPYKISMAYLHKILNWSPIKSDEGKALKSFSLFLVKCRTAMKSISHLCVLDHAPNMQAVVSKLPFHLQTKWRDLVAKIRRDNAKTANFENLADFVQSAADAANDPEFGKEALAKSKEISKKFEKKDGVQIKTKNSSFATNPTLVHGTGPEKLGIVCPLCNSSNDLDDCAIFLKKTIEQRKEYLKQDKMCFACYEKNHIAKGCLQKRKCKKCNKPHPSALHIDDFKLKKQDHESQDEVKNACTKIPVNSPNDVVVVHAIIPVKVKQKGSTETVTTYAFYDNGKWRLFSDRKSSRAAWCTRPTHEIAARNDARP